MISIILFICLRFLVQQNKFTACFYVEKNSLNTALDLILFFGAYLCCWRLLLRIKDKLQFVVKSTSSNAMHSSLWVGATIVWPSSKTRREYNAGLPCYFQVLI